jgi:hypothetical protein
VLPAGCFVRPNEWGRQRVSIAPEAEEAFEGYRIRSGGELGRHPCTRLVGWGGLHICLDRSDTYE